MLPEEFIRNMQAQLGAEYPDFENALQAPMEVSIRKNPFKSSHLVDLSIGDFIPWMKDAFYLLERPVFTIDPLFHGGQYYVQEASSMLVHTALHQWTLDDSKPLKVLDLCASPGGKSTLLTHLGKEHLLVSNEVIKSRYHILQENLIKWGLSGIVISNYGVEHFNKLQGYFDIVLVDAPCSGEGLFRKDSKARQEWSPSNVQLCGVRQQKILAYAQDLVKEGGILLYSTCTYNPIENEQNARWLDTEFDVAKLDFDYPKEWGITALEMGYQCYPHRVRGEGFYFAGFRKKSGNHTIHYRGSKKQKGIWSSLNRKSKENLRDWLLDCPQFVYWQNENGKVIAIPKMWEEEMKYLKSCIPRSFLGTTIGTIKGKDFVPAQGYAMMAKIAQQFPTLNLSKNDALQYLKGSNISINTSPKGWYLARYQSQPLGWLKVLPNRINNYYPKHWRIRMDLDHLVE